MSKSKAATATPGKAQKPQTPREQLRAAQATVRELEERIGAEQQQNERCPDLSTAERLTSDEGVPVARVAPDRIVNLSTDELDSRRRELHVRGRVFQHVDAMPHDGQWIYRLDR